MEARGEGQGRDDLFHMQRRGKGEALMRTDEEIFSSLTNRQRQAAKVLIGGGPCDNLSIGSVLGLQYESVRSLLSHVFDATGMDNRTALAVFLLRRPRLTALLDGVAITPPRRRLARRSSLAP